MPQNTTNVQAVEDKSLNYWKQEQSKDTQLIHLNHQGLVQRNGLLMMKSDNKELIVTPKQHRNDIMYAAHGRKMAAHQGTQRTLAKINQNFWWPGVDKEVERYIKECEQCQKGKNPSKVKPTNLQPLPQQQEPNARVHMDPIWAMWTLYGSYFGLLLVTKPTDIYVCVQTSSPNSQPYGH